MKKTFVLLSIFTITVAMFMACTNTSNNENKDYISTNTNDCNDILFTCPQYQEPFVDGDGCGCQPGEVKDESRTLKQLVGKYLQTRVISFDTEKEEILYEFLYLNGVETFQENYSDLKYEMWAEINKLTVEGPDVKITKTYSGPMILNIKQTGKQYIILGHQSFENSTNDEIANNFSAEAVDWIQDKSADPSADVKKEMKARLTSQVDGFTQLIKELNSIQE